MTPRTRKFLLRAYKGSLGNGPSERFILRHRAGFGMAAVVLCAGWATITNAVDAHRAYESHVRAEIIKIAADKFAACTWNSYGYFWTRKRADDTFSTYRMRMVGEGDTARVRQHPDYSTKISVTSPVQIAITPLHEAAPPEILEHLKTCAEPAEQEARQYQAQYPSRRWHHYLPMMERFF